ncbi:UNVERIFIED_CONTAM: hypothetical protein HDU68_000897 [Siphonaria sp. JEL0065]|nr:hypothetical protein HDU68_000897 [Siphonaria sp. JEL0065]
MSHWFQRGPKPPPPSLWAHFTPGELEAAIKVMEALGDNPQLRQHARDDPDLARLMHATNKSFGDSRWKGMKQRQRILDLDAVRETGIQALRRQGGSNSDAPVADGTRSFPGGSYRIAFNDYNHESEIPNYEQFHYQEPEMLHMTRRCHICRMPYRVLHHFYDQMCPTCGDFNFMKRTSTADMTGRVCLVTGGRIKIGYCIALKLLRANAAKVIVTTRFPNEAACRFNAELDADSFRNRLVIYGIDFRSIPMVQQFCQHIKRTEDRLDVLINNAAQTVRKPPAFYAHLMQGERVVHAIEGVQVMGAMKTVERGYEFRETRDMVQQPRIQGSSSMTLLIKDEDTMESSPTTATALVQQPSSAQSNQNESGPSTSLVQRQSPETAIVNESAAMSQIPMIPDDILTPEQELQFFPPGQVDRHLQQIDFRPVNSWVMDIDQVHTTEMIECHTINSFAPWILISELKELMLRTGPPTGAAHESEAREVWDKYIVNVSAMEGKFHRFKSTHHPHTNMAKASLNMLTRTSAVGFAKDAIFMTAVDTGWVTNENPLREDQTELTRSQPPLDEMDGAMRVLDPIYCGVRGEEKVWGVFLKDYAPTQW